MTNLDERDDERFALLLAGYEEQRAAGAKTDPSARFSSTEDGRLRDRLAKAGRCLEVLEQIWPRAATPGDDEALPEQIDRFEILGQLGRGGFGTVYLAFDPVLRRRVALKVQRPETVLSASLRRRFLREAQAAGSLSHSNIVSVYEVGEAGVLGWIAAEYCRGVSLAGWLGRWKASAAPKVAAMCVAELADAVAYAHRRGILHRDIKPSNVLLVAAPCGEEAEAPNEPKPPPAAEGALAFLAVATPKLTDFGLAKLLHEDSTDTRTGATIGTPGYMAPEQVESRREAVGRPCDVYGLGLVLYELLTARPAFSGGSQAEILRSVLLDEPVAPRRLNREVPRDLEAIVLKSLQKDPQRRYATAEEFAADLRRFLHDEPTAARPMRPPERAWKWTRRHPALALTLVALIVGPLMFLILEHRRTRDLSAALTVISEKERAATTNLELANRREGELNEQLYAMRMRAAFDAYERGIMTVARELLDLYRDAPASKLVGPEYHILWQMAHAEKTVIHAHRGRVMGVAYSPDSKWLASCGTDQIVRVWDAQTGQPVCNFEGHEDTVKSVDFSVNGRWLASGGSDRMLRIWDLQKRQAVASLGDHKGSITCVRFSPDGKGLVSTDAHGYLLLRAIDDLQHPRVARPFNEISDAYYVNENLLAIDAFEEFKLWNLTENCEVGLFEGKGSVVCTEAAGALVTKTGCNVSLFKPPYSKRFARYAMLDTPISCLSASPTIPKCFAAVGIAKSIVQVKSYMSTRGGFLNFHGHTGWIHRIVFSPDGKTLVSAGADGTLRLWNLGGSLPPYGPPGSRLATIERAAGYKDSILAARGNCIVVLKEDSAVLERFVDGQLQTVRTIPLHGQVARAAISERADLLAVATVGKLQLIRLSAGSHDEPIETLTVSGGEPKAIVLAANCGVLALTDKQSTLFVRDVDRRESLEIDYKPCGSLLLSNDGRMLAVSSTDAKNEIDVIPLGPRPKVLSKLRFSSSIKSEAGKITGAFSKNNDLFSVVLADNTIVVYRTTDAQLVKQIRIPWDASKFTTPPLLAFSPDGRTLVGSCDSVLVFWNVATGLELLRLNMTFGDVVSLGFEGADSAASLIGILVRSGSVDKSLVFHARLPDPEYVSPVEISGVATPAN